MRRVLLSTISLLALSVTGVVAAPTCRALPAKAPALCAGGYNWTG